MSKCAAISAMSHVGRSSVNSKRISIARSAVELAELVLVLAAFAAFRRPVVGRRVDKRGRPVGFGMDRIVKTLRLTDGSHQHLTNSERMLPRDLVPSNGLTCPLSETTKIVKTSCRAGWSTRGASGERATRCMRGSGARRGRGTCPANNQSRFKSGWSAGERHNGLQDGAGRAAGQGGEGHHESPRQEERHESSVGDGHGASAGRPALRRQRRGCGSHRRRKFFLRRYGPQGVLIPSERQEAEGGRSYPQHAPGIAWA